MIIHIVFDFKYIETLQNHSVVKRLHHLKREWKAHVVQSLQANLFIVQRWIYIIMKYIYAVTIESCKQPHLMAVKSSFSALYALRNSLLTYICIKSYSLSHPAFSFVKKWSSRFCKKRLYFSKSSWNHVLWKNIKLYPRYGLRSIISWLYMVLPLNHTSSAMLHFHISVVTPFLDHLDSFFFGREVVHRFCRKNGISTFCIKGCSDMAMDIFWCCTIEALWATTSHICTGYLKRPVYIPQ